MVKIFKGIPYTGTLPATLTGTKAGYLHRYKVYGNTEQTSGTPTPENPIVPSECGEKTKNEAWTGWAQDFVTRINDSTRARFETIDGRTCLLFTVSAGTGAYDSKYIFKTDWKENTRYTFSFEALRLSTESTASVMQVWYMDGSSANFPRTINSGDFESYTFTTAVNKTVKYITALFSSRDFRIDIDTFMVSEGSTALPYEPYGYKLPLLSGSTPVDIYIGESQTTRQIKKLVLTGEESWITLSKPPYTYAAPIIPYLNNIDGISSHFVLRRTLQTLTNKTFMFNNGNEIYIKYNDKTSVDVFKQFLADQYANGTPVTVWYVLATPTTGILNEPLRKIGNYADTIDSTQTSAQIPTSADSTTISWAGQGLAPSQFDSIAEWVSATPKIYTNGAWTDAQTYTYDDGAWVADNSN